MVAYRIELVFMVLVLALGILHLDDLDRRSEQSQL